MALLDFADDLELVESWIELDGSGTGPALGRGREIENTRAQRPEILVPLGQRISSGLSDLLPIKRRTAILKRLLGTSFGTIARR